MACTVFAMSLMAAVIIPFSAQFTNLFTNELVSGKRGVQVQLVHGVDTEKRMVWSEYFEFTFVSGNMVTELGRVVAIDENIFLNKPLFFVFAIQDVPGTVTIPVEEQPLAVSSLLSRQAMSVSANAIIGTIPSNLVSGNYTGITGVGVLDSLTVGSRALVVRGDTNRVGIGVTDPTVALDVSGSIRIRNGGITFPDGSMLTAAPQNTFIATGVSSNDQVLIDADTGNRGVGDIRLRTRNTDRLVITNAGKVGIGVSNPIQTLEVAGGIRLGNTQVGVPGTIRYNSGSFEGFDGMQWKALDIQSNSDGIWEADVGLGVVRLRVPTLKVGIGLTNPQYSLDVSGNVRATRFEGAFKGDGSELTGILLQSMNGVLPIEKGGTGTSNFTASGVVVVDPQRNTLTTLPLGLGQLAVGDGSGVKAKTLVAGPGIRILQSSNAITVAHGYSSLVAPSSVEVPGVVLAGIELDTFGHVSRMVTTNLDERFYTKEEADTRFLTTSGGTITGVITMDRGSYIAGNGPLVLAPSSGSNVGIGVSDPKQKLDIAGAIRIGNTTQNEPGSIRFVNGRFEGFSGSIWRYLDDSVTTDSGWVLTGTNVSTLPGLMVGIGTSNPQVALAVSGNVLISGTATIQGSVSVNQAIWLGDRQITPGRLPGNWQVADGIIRATQWRIGDVSGIQSDASVVVAGGLLVNNQLKIGNVVISANGMATGPWQFNQITVNTIVGDSGLRLIPNGRLQLGSALEIDGSVIRSLNPELNMVISANQMVSIMSTLNTPALVVGSVVTIDAKLGGMGINIPPQNGFALSVSGDVVIGRYDNLPAGGKVGKSDLFVEGNLVVEGTLYYENTFLSVVDSPSGGQVANVTGSKMNVGPVYPTQVAKFNVRGDRSLNDDVVDIRSALGELLLVAKESGRLGVGVSNPSAYLHLRAGTSSIPPLRLEAGPLTLTPVPGAFEHDQGRLFFTNDQGMRMEIGLINASQTFRNKTFQQSSIDQATLQNPTLYGSMTIATGARLVLAGNTSSWIEMGTLGRLGIGLSNPQATLDVAGSIRIGDAVGSTAEGTIAYRLGRFYGVTPQGWVPLDNSLYEGAVTFTDQSRQFGYSNVNLGIKTTTPRVELDVNGVVAASQFVGDGSQLTGLTMAQFAGVLPVSRGGTGLSSIPDGAFLIGNSGDTLNTFSIPPGNVVIGTGSGPIAGSITGGTGISVSNVNSEIIISLTGGTLLPLTNTIPLGRAISKIELDGLGRLMGLETRSLDDIYLKKTDADALYVPISGGTMTGPLILDVDGADITTLGNGNLNLVPGGTGRVGIGQTNPQVMLDIAGAIRIGDTDVSGLTEENRRGIIRYRDHRFQGYTNLGWVNLDVGETVEGVFTAGQFQGDGSLITNLNPLHFSTPVPVSKGGTGVGYLAPKSLLIGNGTNPINTLVLPTNYILMGSDAGPVGVQLKGVGIRVVVNSNEILIEHPSRNANLPSEVLFEGGDVLQSLNFDNEGHVVAVITRNMDVRYYTKPEVDTLLKRGGDQLVTGALIFNLSNPQRPAITSLPDQHLLLTPGGSGSILFGVDQILEGATPALVSIGGDGYGRSGPLGGVQLELGGQPNIGVNQFGTKLLISNYSSFGSVYPIYVKDNANQVDFFVKSRSGANPSLTYIGGNLFVGVPTSDSQPQGTVMAQFFKGDGSQLTNLTADNLSGVLPVSKGGTGLSSIEKGAILLGNNSSYLLTTRVLKDGELLIGDGIDEPSIGTIQGTAGQITVTNEPGKITLSLPQSIATSASPTFSSLTLSGELIMNQAYSQIRVPSGSPLIILPATGVGIGKTQPLYFLDVAGSMRIAGDMVVENNLTIGKSATVADLTVQGSVALGSGIFDLNASNRTLKMGNDTNPMSLQLNGALQITGLLQADELSATSLYISGGAQANKLTVSELQISNSLTLPGVFTFDTLNRRVGINTTTPQSTLDVRGDMRVEGGLNLNGNLGVSSNLWVNNGSGTGLLVDSAQKRVGINTVSPRETLDVSGNMRVSGNLEVTTLTVNTRVLVGNTTTPILMVDASRNRVGINEANPAYTLDVGGDVRVRDSLIVQDITIQRNASLGGNVLVINQELNRVGIGTSTPVAPLDVAGDAQFRQNVRFGDVLFIDQTNRRMGINQPTPSVALDIIGDISIVGGGQVSNLVVTNSLVVSNAINSPVLSARDGKVGINTNAPQTQLDVRGNVLLTGRMNANSLQVTGDVLVQSEGGDPLFVVRSTSKKVGVNREPSTELDVSGNIMVSGHGTIQRLDILNGLQVGMGTGEKVNVFTVDSVASRVGINTNSPQSTLDVVGSARFSEQLTVNQMVANDLTVGTVFKVNPLLMRIGINTMTPETALHVVGDMAVVNGTTYLSGLDVTGNVMVNTISGDPVLWVNSQTNQVGIRTRPIGGNAWSVKGDAYVTGGVSANRLTVRDGISVGVNWLVVTMNRVGINTANPTVELTVSGNALFTGGLQAQSLQSSGNLVVGTTLMVDTGLNRVGINQVNPKVALDIVGDMTLSGGLWANELTVTHNVKIGLVSGRGGLMVNVDTNRVGINTETPRVALDVVGSASFSQIYSNSMQIDDELSIHQPLGLQKTILTRSGGESRVGIGIPVDRAPNSALEVQGNAFISGIVTANLFVGDGSMLTNLKATNISGVLQASNGGTGISQLPELGDVLIGKDDGTFALGKIGVDNTGLHMSVVGTDIQLGLIQPISTVSTPTFGGMNLTGPLSLIGQTSVISVPNAGNLLIELGSSSSRIGIGTTEPEATLDVRGSGQFSDNLIIGSLLSGIKLDKTGKVGIGVISPQAALHVIGGAIVSGDLTVNEGLTFNGGITAANQRFKVQVIGGNVRVGIGLNPSVSPQFSLDVSGDTRISGQFIANIVSINQELVVDSIQVERVLTLVEGILNVDLPNRRLGIGKVNPQVALDVSGDVSISDGLRVNQNTLVVDAINQRVGVGVASPVVPFEVSGNTVIAGRFQVGGVNLSVGVLGTPTLIVDSSTKRVGIGTANPSATLGVEGVVEVQGTVTANVFVGSGANLYSLNASSVTSGTLPVSRGGTGLSGSDISGTEGQLLRSTGTGYQFVSLQSSDLSISHSSGIISFTLPQSIVTNASPTFRNITLTNGLSIQGGGGITLSSLGSVFLNAPRLGIGKNPDVELDVNGSIKVSTRANIGNSIVIDGVAKQIGIGTLTPSTTLDVNGSVLVSGTLNVAQELMVSGNVKIGSMGASKWNGLVVDVNSGFVGIGTNTRFSGRSDTVLEVNGPAYIRGLSVDRLDLNDSTILIANRVVPYSNSVASRVGIDLLGVSTFNMVELSQLTDRDNTRYQLDLDQTSVLNVVEANTIQTSRIEIGNHVIEKISDTQIRVTAGGHSVVLDSDAIMKLAVSQLSGAVSSTYMPTKFVDIDNPIYRVDPSGTTYLKELLVDIIRSPYTADYYLNMKGSSRLIALTTQEGFVTKGAAGMDIPHPNSVKKSQGYRLRHSFVQTNTAGGNLYKYRVTLPDSGTAQIELPDYFNELNQNAMVWVTPHQHFGRAYATIVNNTCTVSGNSAGDYNVLIFAERKDPTAVTEFQKYGVEYR